MPLLKASQLHYITAAPAPILQSSAELRCSTTPVAHSTLAPWLQYAAATLMAPSSQRLILSFPAGVLQSKTAKLLCCATAPLPLQFSALRRNCILVCYASAAQFTAVQLGFTATLRLFTLAPWLNSSPAPLLKIHSLLPHSATVSLFTPALCPIVLAVSLCLCCKAPW